MKSSPPNLLIHSPPSPPVRPFISVVKSLHAVLLICVTVLIFAVRPPLSSHRPSLEQHSDSINSVGVLKIHHVTGREIMQQRMTQPMELTFLLEHKQSG
ncbi:unnamed protein product [Urochloa humidicola]